MIKVKIEGSLHDWDGVNDITIGDTAHKPVGGKAVKGALIGNGLHSYKSKALTITSEKLCKIELINPEAEQRIKALDWKKERASEQPSKYSLDEVLAERQAIRDASNKAKVDIEALTTIEEVKAFTW